MECDTPVVAVRVDYLCDTCGEPMKPTGQVFTSYPAQYPHKCSNGHLANLRAMYPMIEHRSVSDARL